MESPSTDQDVFVCDDCESVTFADRPADCCDESMEALDAEGPPTVRADLEELLRSVYGMSNTELEVCLCVMEHDEMTAADVAGKLDVDRSLTSRHLNHLADLGVVEKTRRIRKAGGHVNVYRPVEPETVRRRLKAELYRWLRDAVATVDEITAEKVAALAESGGPDTEPRVYE